MRVLLVPDVKGWAWDHKATAIQKCLSHDFDVIDKIYTTQFRTHASKLVEQYDSVHIFGWMDCAGIANRITAGVSSYNYEIKRLQLAKKKMPKFLALTAVSKLLYDQMIQQQLNKTIYYTPNGVDHTLFVPQEKPLSKVLTVGWLGQPTHGYIGKDRHSSAIDQHGYTSILKPLQQELSKYNDIEFKILAKGYRNALPHKDLVSFYNQCDCQIHPGYLAGTPNPIFEAASCGRAVICTRIGAANEMIQDNVNGFLIDSYASVSEVPRVIKEFADKIIYLKNNRDVCIEMGKKSREIIENSWTWEQRSRNWIPVFQNHRTH